MQNGLWHTPSSALALLFVVPKKEESHNAHAEDQLLMKGQRMRIDEKEQKKGYNSAIDKNYAGRRARFTIPL